MIEAGDSRLFAKLPNVANLSKVDPDGYATRLTTALRTAGKVGAILADLVQSATDARLENKRADAAALTAQVHLYKGQASVADLKSLLTSAESLIHNTVEPGSPLLDLLKPPHRPRKRKGAGEKKKAAGEQEPDKEQQASKTTSGDAAHPPTAAGGHRRRAHDARRATAPEKVAAK